MSSSRSNNLPPDVQSYEFASFASSDEKKDEKKFSVKDFEIKELTGAITKNKEVMINVIKTEKNKAEENNFKILPVVKKFRGIREVELQERREAIEGQVQKKLGEVQEEAYQKRHNSGEESGRALALTQELKIAEEKIASLVSMIDELKNLRADIMLKQKNEVYLIVKGLVKWVVLKELKDDGQYIQRLLEKLILELQSRNNLIVSVNEEHYKKMPEIFELVQKKLGEIQNTRVEIIHDPSRGGLILESDNGILNGTIDEQFLNLDKMFESVIMEGQ